MKYNSHKAALEARAELVEKAKVALERTRGCSVSNEDIASAHREYDAIMAEAGQVTTEIETLKRSEELAKIAVRPEANQVGYNYGVTKRDHDLALRGAICEFVGDYAGAEQFRSAMNKVGACYNPSLLGGEQYRAQTVGTNSEGGYLATQTLANFIETKRAYFCKVEQYAKIVPTGKGMVQNIPTFDNTGGASGVASHDENAEVANADKAVGNLTLGAKTYATANFPISIDLIRDADFDIYSWIGEAIGEDLGRNESSLYQIGNTTEHQGIVTGSTLGKTCASATAFTWLEIQDLLASIDYYYHGLPTFALGMHWDTYQKLVKLVNSNGDTLFKSSIAEGAGMKFDGKPVVIMDKMDSALTASKKLVIAGDFNKFAIRKVGSPNVITLKERYATQLAVGFVGHSTTGCKVIQPAAIKHMKLAAS